MKDRNIKNSKSSIEVFHRYVRLAKETENIGREERERIIQPLHEQLVRIRRQIKYWSR